MTEGRQDAKSAKVVRQVNKQNWRSGLDSFLLLLFLPGALGVLAAQIL